MCMHLTMSYHLLCIHDTYVVHMHRIGVPKGVTLLEYEQRAIGGAAGSLGVGGVGGRRRQ
jgi:hypothetical protein